MKNEENLKISFDLDELEKYFAMAIERGNQAATKAKNKSTTLIPTMDYNKNKLIESVLYIKKNDPEIYNDSELLNPASYGVGKAGILAFTRYVASFWGKYNIRCNAISPGPFLDIQDNDSPHKKKFIENLNNKTVLGRTGQPQELIGALIFLSSNASSYITGHNLVIDGGWTIR